MPLTELDHFFVRSRNLERSRRFYCDGLGFEVMPRPDFPFPGLWLGVGGKVQVHMGLDGIEGEAAHYFGTGPNTARDNAGVVDHIAFQGSDPQGLCEHLDELGIRTRKRFIAEIGLLQLFVTDPDGLTIELNFRGLAAEPAWAAQRDAWKPG